MTPKVRPPVVDAMQPCQWPDWLLGYAHGWHEDPDVQRRLLDGFHQWQRDRNDWVAANRPDLSLPAFLLLTYQERARRR